jgi:hypothetical protein
VAETPPPDGPDAEREDSAAALMAADKFEQQELARRLAREQQRKKIVALLVEKVPGAEKVDPSEILHLAVRYLILRTPRTASKTDTEKELQAVKRHAVALKEHADGLYLAIQKLHNPARMALADIDTARVLNELNELDLHLFDTISDLVATIDTAKVGKQTHHTRAKAKMLADLTAEHWLRFSGQCPTASWSPLVGAYVGPFPDLVTGLFSVLGIGGSGAQAARDAVERLGKKPSSEDTVIP